MKFIKNNMKYLFVFLLTSIIFLFFEYINTYDAIWNYGFSYAFANHLIPFRDFNIITPGFYPFLYSLGLRIFQDNYIFLLEQSFFVTLSFYFVYKMYGKKSWLYLLFLFLPTFKAITPTYNFFCLFLLIVILYLEKNEKKDFLIGVLLGIVFLTKHTIGIFLLIPSVFLYYKDFSKIKKRFFGLICPITLYVLYLLMNGIFFSFFDLCFLGLFDFASQNTNFIFSFFVVTGILLFILIVSFVKGNNKLLTSYLICFYSVMLPTFSSYHFYVFLAAFSLFLIEIIPFQDTLIRNYSLLFIFLILLFNSSLIDWKDSSFSNDKNFQFVYRNSNSIQHIHYLNSFYQKYKKLGDVELLSSKNVAIKAMNQDSINYFGVFLNGNYGYNGSEKMKKIIDNRGECYYILDLEEYQMSVDDPSKQFDISSAQYIIHNSILVDDNKVYPVYYFGGNYETIEN